MIMGTLGQRLTVFRAVALCDRHEHEHAIVTDGQRAYVWPIDGAHVTEDTIVNRVGVTLTAACPVGVAPRAHGSAEDYDPIQCGGQLVWRLDTPDSWTSDADARRLLTAYGHGVEQ